MQINPAYKLHFGVCPVAGETRHENIPIVLWKLSLQCKKTRIFSLLPSSVQTRVLASGHRLKIIAAEVVRGIKEAISEESNAA
jgi:hypothetical protein